MMIFNIFILLITFADSSLCETVNHEQVHISLGTDETEMLVTWSALISADLGQPRVQWGKKGEELSFLSMAERSHFEDNGLDMYVYRALLRHLEPGQEYEYKVGDNSNYSKIFSFKTLNNTDDWLPRFAIYGDLGLVNGESLPFLKKDVEKSMYDVIFHVGDFAYNLDDDNGTRGNVFMNDLEPVASKVPYMTCPGNHEQYSNFSHYDARFTMLGDRSNPQVMLPITERMNNHYHSMDIGPAHIVMFSTEMYYFTEYYNEENYRQQFEWLEKDLRAAHENRHNRPWIVVMGHRPMYCFKLDHSCDMNTLERVNLRQGFDIDGTKKYGLEDLFLKYGVDLQFYGHDHYYTRTLPLYNFKTRFGNLTEYTDPNAPVHILTGSAGNKEQHAKFNPLIDGAKYVGYHSPDYGYTRLTFVEKLKIKIEQLSDEKNGEIIDEIVISKTHETPNWLL